MFLVIEDFLTLPLRVVSSGKVLRLRFELPLR